MKYLYYSLLIAALFLTGCASNNGQHDSLVKYGSANAKAINIKSASLTLTVRNVNEVTKKIIHLAEQSNGQFVSNKNYKNKVQLKVNVPAQQLDSVLNQMATYGDVSHKNIMVTNVSDSLIDTEARLKNLHALRERYRALMSKASSVEDLLAIERELSKVQTQLDTFEGKQKSLLGQVAYSTVNITIKERVVYGPLGHVANVLMWTIKKLFVLN